MIILNHCHIFPEGVYDMIEELPKCGSQTGTVQELKKGMRKLGAEKAVVFGLFEQLVKMDSNEWLVKTLEGEKDLLGFVTVNPCASDSAEKLRRYVEKGCVGVKIHPPVMKFRINDPEAEPFYKMAEKLRIPLLFHTGVHGWNLKFYRPILLDDVAQAHPDLPIIIEHTGGFAFFYEALAVLQNNRNCYAGIAQTRGQDYRWYMSPERLDILIEMIGPGRIIYGADFPFNTVEGIAEDIKAIKSLKITKEDKMKILGGNIARLVNRVE